MYQGMRNDGQTADPFGEKKKLRIRTSFVTCVSRGGRNVKLRMCGEGGREGGRIKLDRWTA
jgi:hypothetical protein